MGPDRPVAEVDVSEGTTGRKPPLAGVDEVASPVAQRRRAVRDPVVAAARVAHVVSLAGAVPLIVWFNRDQWFFGDEWAFFAHRMSGWGRVLFEPHNEHWSTAPILLYRAVYSAVGVRSYLPYVAVLVVLHVAATHLLWRVMNRAGVAPLVSTGLAAVFAVLGSGGENLLWAFQIGFVGAVAAGLLHLLLVDHAGPFGRRDRLAWLVAVAGLLFSGIGVTMTATSGLVVLLRRGVKDAVATVAPPAAVYLLWLATVGRDGLDAHDRTLAGMLDVPEYLWTGLTSALERASGIPGGGGVIVVLVLAWLLRQRAVVRAPGATATAMAAGSVVLFVVLAVGRTGLGAEQATSGRYVYIAAALVLPAVGAMLSEGTRGLAARQVAAAAVLIPVLIHNVGVLRAESHREADREAEIRSRLLGAAELAESAPALAATQPEPMFSPNVTMELLRRLDAEGALPAGPVTEADVLAAATYVQVGLADAPPSGGGTVPSVGAAVDERGCLLVGPLGAAPVDVRFAEPSAIPLRAPGGGDVTVALHSGSQPGLRSEPRKLKLRAGVTEWLLVTRAGNVTVAAPSSAVELCGVRAG